MRRRNSLSQKSQSSIIDSQGPLSEPRGAVRPWRQQPPNLPHTCRSQYPPGSAQLGGFRTFARSRDERLDRADSGGGRVEKGRSPVPRSEEKRFPKCELPHTSRPIPERCCLRVGRSGRSSGECRLRVRTFTSLHRAFSPWRPACWRSRTPRRRCSGVYPTERIVYKKLVIDAVPAHADGAHPLEEAQPIDLATALSAPEEFGCLEERQAGALSGLTILIEGVPSWRGLNAW
jgi:hypothetical protein